MGDLNFTYKLTLACAWLVWFICHLDLALSVEIKCIPLKSCPTVLKLLISTKKYAPDAVEFLKNSHCGFDRKGQPKVWCAMLNFCKTPDNENGTCTPIKKCEPFLQLAAALDPSDLDTETFLNQFRCNTILKEAHVCCPDENLAIKPNFHITPRISDVDYPDYDTTNYGWLGDEPQYHNHHDHGVRDVFRRNSHQPDATKNHRSWHNSQHEEDWDIPRHIHNHGFHEPERWNIHREAGGFRHHNTPEFAHGTRRDNPDHGFGFNNRDISNNEAGDVSHHNEGNSDGSSEEDVPTQNSRKPQKQTTPRSPHSSTTQRQTTPRGRQSSTTQRQTTQRSRQSSTTERQTTPRSRQSSTTERRTTPRSRQSSTTQEHHSTRKDWTTERQATLSNRDESSTKNYDSESTTRSDRRSQQRTTPGSSDDGQIIFEDSFETENSGTSERTTNQVTAAARRNDQNKSCETPDRKAGVCTKQSQCQPYLKLQNNLDKSKKSVSDYLKKFVCNSTTTEEISVCCQNEEEDIDNTVISAERTNEDEPEPHEKICGRQRANTDRIFGGTNAALGEFPWMALLQYPSDRGLVSGCGGALINARYVLTAAHCVDEEILKTKRLQPLRQVILGEYDTRNKTDCIYMMYGTNCADPIVTYGVESIVSHSLYDSDTTRNDIALVRLNREVTYTDYIVPICLPTKTLTLKGNETFVLAGWGRTPTETSSPTLKKVKIPFAQKQTCNALNIRRRSLTDGQFCVGRGNGTDSCSGDSGGPIMLEVKSKFEFVTNMIGIVSYGIKDCGEGPSVNTYVPNYIDWINDNMR